MKLIRITTEEGLELQGMLFEPDKKSDKAIIHVHGWTGNFYENKFIDNIAKQVVSNGHAFLTFNNRGAGIIQDFIKRNKFKTEYVRIGGSLEKFEECLIDIKAAIDFLENRGYQQIILQGHSTGCQKITFYQHKAKDHRVKGLILLAPVDDVGFAKKSLGNKYQKALIIAKEMVKKKNGQSPVPKWMAFYPVLAADMFLNVADPDSLSGRIFDYSGKLVEIKQADCPILAVFGSDDEYETDPADKLIILKGIKNCETKLITDSNHGFVNFEDILSQIIGNWLNSRNL